MMEFLLGCHEGRLPPPIARNQGTISHIVPLSMDGADLPAHRQEMRISFKLHPKLLMMELMKDESWWPRETKTDLNSITDNAHVMP